MRQSTVPTLSERFASLDFRIDISAWVFWLVFVLSYLASRILVLATGGIYRTGLVVFAIGALLLISQLRLINRQLLVVILSLLVITLLSGIANQSPVIDIVSVARIPVTVYLVYFVVASYFKNRERVIKVFRLMYLIALVQLPVLIIQRLSYPYLPAPLKYSELQNQLDIVDFAMGTFDGDAPMTFFLIALLILLLFYKQSSEFVRRKWFMAVWLTLTVLVGNSQIQHITVVLVWAIYLLSHLRLKTITIFASGTIILALAIGYLDQSGVLTFAPIEHTRGRFMQVFSTTGRQERIESFLAGSHARDGAIYYYLEQPIKWLGDGPGRYYNTVARNRTLGSWGHLFTFYAEIGLIGWLLSMFVFFIIAFPLTIERSKITLQISWVQALMFLAVCILSMAKYPMNTIPMIFTYCVVLVGHRIIVQPRYLRIV